MQQQHQLTVEEYADVPYWINHKYIEDVTGVQTTKPRANQKPWLTGEVHSLLKIRNAAFRSKDTAAYRLDGP